jgi:hypothetical protein
MQFNIGKPVFFYNIVNTISDSYVLNFEARLFEMQTNSSHLHITEWATCLAIYFITILISNGSKLQINRDITM